MAKVQLSSVAEHVSGKVGDLVFYDKPGGTVLQAAPAKSDKPRSPKQLAGQDRFSQGAAYAKAALQDPRLRPVYQERYDRLQRQGKRNSLFSLAVQDHLRPPQVKAVSLFDYCGRPGDLIHVDADDDTEVARVEVIICTPEGVVLEHGPAEACLNWWEYRATVAAPLGTCPLVTAVAYDLPGHTGELTMALTEQGHPIGPLVWVPAEAEELDELRALEGLGALEEPEQPVELEEPEPAVAEAPSPAPVAEAAIPEPAEVASATEVLAPLAVPPAAVEEPQPAPDSVGASEVPASTPPVEAPAVFEAATPAAPEPAWYWVPGWPVRAPTPAWTATALVAVPGEAEPALPSLWSAPDYTGWPGEPASPPCEVEVQAVPVETVMYVPVAAALGVQAVPVETIMRVPAAPAVTVPVVSRAPTRGRPRPAMPEPAERAAHDPRVPVERKAHPPPAHVETHSPGPRAGEAEEVNAPADLIVVVAAAGSDATTGRPATRPGSREGGLAQMCATTGPAPPPTKRG